MITDSVRKKLRLDKYSSCSVFNRRHESCLDALPQASQIEGVSLLIAFAYTLEEMRELLDRGYSTSDIQALYFVYPKKGNKLGIPHIGRDDIFPALGVNIDTGVAEGTNLRFNMMVSLDDNFTIIGVRREELSGKVKTERRCSNDFAQEVPRVEAMLSADERANFSRLAPGYQREWTAHILSAKGDATRAKRLEQLCQALRLGYKTIEQLRKHKSTEE